MFLVRLCAVVGGVYATVGMVYNHLSLLGCSVKRFTQEDTKKEAHLCQPSHKSRHKKSGSISSNILTANSLVPPPGAAFETPFVQLVGGATDTKPLCDLTLSQSQENIDITSSSSLINGQLQVGTGTSQLPDLLASSRSPS